jgi:hypothetical protein
LGGAGSVGRMRVMCNATPACISNLPGLSNVQLVVLQSLQVDVAVMLAGGGACSVVVHVGGRWSVCAVCCWQALRCAGWWCEVVTGAACAPYAAGRCCGVHGGGVKWWQVQRVCRMLLAGAGVCRVVV